MINFFRNLFKRNNGYRVTVHRYSSGQQFEVFNGIWMSASEARAAGQAICQFLSPKLICTYDVEKNP